MDGIAIVVGDTPGDPLQIVVVVEDALAVDVIVIATSVPAFLILPVLLVVPDLALVLSRNGCVMPDNGLNGTARAVIGLTPPGLGHGGQLFGGAKGQGLELDHIGSVDRVQ